MTIIVCQLQCNVYKISTVIKMLLIYWSFQMIVKFVLAYYFLILLLSLHFKHKHYPVG